MAKTIDEPIARLYKDIYPGGLTIGEFLDEVKTKLGIETDAEVRTVELGYVDRDGGYIECIYSRPETEQDRQDKIRAEKKEKLRRLQWQINEAERLKNAFGGKTLAEVLEEIDNLKIELNDA